MSDRDDPRKVEQLLSRCFGWLDQIDRPKTKAVDDVSLFGGRAGQRRALNGGVQWRFNFVNGYGASVVRHSFSYGGDYGLWEVAVTDHDGHLRYDTPITDDVVGWLTEYDVISLLTQIESFEAQA